MPDLAIPAPDREVPIMILNILLLVSMVALLTVVPLLPGLITARLVRSELVHNPRGVAEL